EVSPIENFWRRKPYRLKLALFQPGKQNRIECIAYACVGNFSNVVDPPEILLILLLLSQSLISIQSRPELANGYLANDRKLVGARHDRAERLVGRSACHRSQQIAFHVQAEVLEAGCLTELLARM